MKEGQRIIKIAAGTLAAYGVLTSACGSDNDKDNVITTSSAPTYGETRTPFQTPKDVPTPTSIPVVTPFESGNQALVLDGRADGVQINDSESLHIRGPITIEARVKLLDQQGIDQVLGFGSDAVISKGQSTEAYGMYANLIGCSNKAGAFLVDRTFCADVQVQKGVWNDLAVIYDKEKIVFYLNGQQVGVQPWSGDLILNSEPLFIGQSPFGISNEDFSGEIDSVAIWNTARTADQMKEDFGGKFRNIRLSEGGNLVGLWQFDGDYSDSTPNHNDGIPLFDAHFAPVSD